MILGDRGISLPGMNLGQMLTAIREEQLRQQEAELCHMNAVKRAEDEVFGLAFAQGFEIIKATIEQLITHASFIWNERYDGVLVAMPLLVRQQIPFLDHPLNRDIRNDFEHWLNHQGLNGAIVYDAIVDTKLGVTMPGLLIRPLF